MTYRYSSIAQFRHILNYLRGGALYIPPPGREFDELSADVDFYRIGSYKTALSQQATSPTCVLRYSLAVISLPFMLLDSAFI